MRFLLSILSWLFVVGLTSCQQEQPKVTPEYRKLTSAVYASGSIEPLDAYQVFAPAAGILEEKLVVEGNVVEPGEPLFVIRQETTSLQLTGARERLTTAERNASPNSALLQQARLQLEQARERYLQDSTDYQRQQNLLAKNATPRRSVEQARLAFISSKSALQSAKVNLEQLNDNLKDQLREAQIQYQIAAEERGNTIVKSRNAETDSSSVAHRSLGICSWGMNRCCRSSCRIFRLTIKVSMAA